ACREFLTQPHSHPVLGKVVRRMIVGPPGDGPQSIVEEPIISNEDNFFAALGKLRGIFGQQLADIAYLYRIDLEEQLASILPPEPKVTISRGTIACSRWTGVSASASSAFENGSEHGQSAAMHGANASRPLYDWGAYSLTRVAVFRDPANPAGMGSVRCHPGRGAIVRGGDNTDRRGRRRNDRA